MIDKIGPLMEFQGEFRSQENLIIKGTIDGYVENSKDLVIEESAKIEANLKAKNITIKGKIKGDIEAEEKLEISATGEIIGNIKAKTISIIPGAIFIGQCESRLVNSRQMQVVNLDKADLSNINRKNNYNNEEKNIGIERNKMFLAAFFKK
ncbi:MAG: polymer-forming cytoskeletal protein [Patescibacteria group bacterium]